MQALGPEFEVHAFKPNRSRSNQKEDEDEVY